MIDNPSFLRCLSLFLVLFAFHSCRKSPPLKEPLTVSEMKDSGAAHESKTVKDEHRDAADDTAEIEGEIPVEFPVKEDVSAVADEVAGLKCYKIYVTNDPSNFFIKCSKCKEKIYLEYETKPCEYHLLQRIKGKWDLIQLPWGDTFDLHYTSDGVIYVARREKLLKRNENGEFEEIKNKKIKHPVGIWGCGGNELIVISVDRTDYPQWNNWDLHDVLFYNSFNKARVRIHVLSDKGDCIIPKGKYIPLYLECSKDTPMLHLLTDDKDEKYTKCGIDIRKHPAKTSSGCYFGDKFDDIFCCEKKECKDKTVAVCMAEHITGNNSLIIFDGENVSHMQGAGYYDYYIDCDSVIYKDHPAQYLQDGEWVTIPGWDKKKGSIFNIENDGIIWTIRVTGGLYRYYQGKWETVLTWSK